MFKIQANEKAVSDVTSTGSYMNTSGIYPVTINFASVSKTRNGAEQINFNVTNGETTKTFYGPYYKQTNGEYNEIAVSLYSKLGVIIGLEDGAEFTTETEERMVGMPAKPMELEVIQELVDVPVYMHIKAKYNLYQGNIKENLEIRSFFRAEDSASAAEILKGSNFGDQMTVVEEKYASDVTYEDGLTEEEVKDWKHSRKNSNGEAKKGPTPKAKPKAPAFKPNPFAK